MAKVVGVCGSPIVIGADGKIRLLQVGDSILPNEIIQTPTGSVVRLALDNGQIQTINPNSELVLSENNLNNGNSDILPTSIISTGGGFISGQVTNVQITLFNAHAVIPEAGFTTGSTAPATTGQIDFNTNQTNLIPSGSNLPESGSSGSGTGIPNDIFNLQSENLFINSNAGPLNLSLFANDFISSGNSFKVTSISAPGILGSGVFGIDVTPVPTGSPTVVANYIFNDNSIFTTPTVPGSPADLTVHQDGTFNFSLQNTFDYLPIGSSLSISFNYTVEDAFGQSNTSSMHIEITGQTNTAGFLFYAFNSIPGTVGFDGGVNQEPLTVDYFGSPSPTQLNSFAQSIMPNLNTGTVDFTSLPPAFSSFNTNLIANNIDVLKLTAFAEGPSPGTEARFWNIIASDANNIIFGPDKVHSYDLTATIYAGKGDDVVNFGSMDTKVYGGEGNDIINTGSGNDIFAYQTVLDGHDIINGFTSGQDTINLTELFDSLGVAAVARSARVQITNTATQTWEVSVDTTGTSVFDFHLATVHTATLTPLTSTDITL